MILDTSFLVALFIKEDELHEKAMDLIEKLENQKLLLPDRVLEETFTVLSYKKGVKFALEVLNKLSINKDIINYRFNEAEYETILRLIKKLKKRLSFVDYIVVYLCLKNSERPLSFDEDIKRLVPN